MAENADGICYRARHDPSRLCAAIFDRAQDVIMAPKLGGLAEAGQMTRQGQVLDHYRFELV